MDNRVKCETSYKVLVLGDCGVGKTALIQKLVGKDGKLRTTVAPDFVNKTFDVENARIQLCIWDTPGQERFRSVTRSQLKDVQGVALVYSIVDKASFDLIEYWITALNEDVNANGRDDEPLPMVLIGNKVDLFGQRQVDHNSGQKANRNMMVGYTEASAVTGENIEDIFYRLAYFITDTINPELLCRTLPYGSRVKLTENSQNTNNDNPGSISSGLTEEKKKKKRLCGCVIL